MSGREELASLAGELRARLELPFEPEWGPGGRMPPPPPVAEAGAPAARADAGLGKRELLARLAEQVSACRKCPLGSQRLRAVFGVGSPDARVLFVGEGPGFQEDHTGEPFVGRAGQLLDKILASIGLARESVYIANIVKCHPMTDPSDPEARGNDRPPAPEEIAACRPYLDAQIRAISPRCLVALGSVAARVLLGVQAGITSLRGRWTAYSPLEGGEKVPLLPTYHPAALLRNPNLKKDVWEDMKSLRRFLEEAA